MNEHSWRELVGEERPVGFDQVAIGIASSDTMGHLIPAGTGFPEHRQLKLVEKGEPVGAPVMEEAEPQPAIG